MEIKRNVETRLKTAIADSIRYGRLLRIFTFGIRLDKSMINLALPIANTGKRGII